MQQATRRILLLLLLTAGASRLTAQQALSYIYIQGDKQTPFYVKLEGEMQPRYGKNYCIIPQLVPGPVHLEVLFQQNAYPSQKFTVLVPEQGHRGFLITRRNNAFALFDLQQQFYLMAGNTEADDHLPSPDNPVAAVIDPPRETPAAAPVKTEQEPVRREPRPARPKPAVTASKPVKKPATRTVATKPAAAKPDNREPRFLNGIELPTGTPAAGGQVPVSASGQQTHTPASPVAGTFRNSDCPEAMDEAAFEQVYKGMMERKDDEDRIEYLNRQMDGCYRTWQARTLGTLLSGDAARYSFLKRVYPRISDQASFPLLDDLLTSDVWKAEFQKLIHP